MAVSRRPWQRSVMVAATMLLLAGGALVPAGAASDLPSTAHTMDREPEGANGWHRSPVTLRLHADGGAGGIAATEYRVDGGDWQTYGSAEEIIFDGTSESFERWRQAGPGGFELLPDGSILSRGGLGMLWYPERAYGDVALKLEWRDVRPAATGASNSGVFMRFPHPDEAVARPEAERYPCQTGSAQTQPAWVAIACGHEIQIYDGTTGEPQKTGSIYNFAPLDLEQARPNTQGEWTEYEIRTVGGGDYTVTVLRDGEVIQEWQNSPGQQAMREGDPGTTERQFASGYIGLQNHGNFDATAFRNIRVQHLTESITIDTPGRHLVEYRSTDQAGNVEEARSVLVKYDPAAPTTTAAVEPSPDADGAHGGPVTVTLDATDDAAGVLRTEYRIDGGDWEAYQGPEEAIFDGTAESFERWRQAGPGHFELTEDGSIRSIGGLGMLWYPEEYGDVALKLRWREAREDNGHSNSGVFVRFPDPDAATGLPRSEAHLCQLGLGLWEPAWVAIGCGHEIQIYDGPDGEPQKTGSIYNFSPIGLGHAAVHDYGDWNDYEIRTVGDGTYEVTVIRNGEVINTFVNAPGQWASRPYDPPTDLRQFPAGHIGLQNHGGSDFVEFRDVRVEDLAAAAFTLSEPGTYTVEYRSVDRAGNVEEIRELTVTITG